MINDSAFLASASSSSVGKIDFSGIADPKGGLGKVAELLNPQSVPENDLFPAGTSIEFLMPDNSKLLGKVASKCGDEYLINANDGESYLIPIGKLSKINNVKLAEVIQQEIMPELNLVLHQHIDSRVVAIVDYKGKNPLPSVLAHVIMDVMSEASPKDLYKAFAKDLQPLLLATLMPDYLVRIQELAEQKSEE
ncbi:hypothetical protein LCGC14_2960900 [marine sediment metagenome]|uniref:Uncharacterized protein n=1 Tax=marine sediment metagenome TaxID=412755 RepID=A0A0F8XZK6_9ZZZZ